MSKVHRAIELILQGIQNEGEHKAAVVVLVTADDQLETAAMGIDNKRALFEVLYSVTAVLASEIYADLPAEQQKPMLAYPSLEEARRLGLRIERNGKN